MDGGGGASVLLASEKPSQAKLPSPPAPLLPSSLFSSQEAFLPWACPDGSTPCAPVVIWLPSLPPWFPLKALLATLPFTPRAGRRAWGGGREEGLLGLAAGEAVPGLASYLGH